MTRLSSQEAPSHGSARSRWGSCAAATALAALLLTACADLDTRYGWRGSDSVNGLDVLEELWAERLSLRQKVAAGAELGAYDLLVHLETSSTELLPERLEQHAEKLDQWLRSGRDRHLVLLLREEAMGGWLCRRWANEARTAAQSLSEDSGERADLMAQANSLDQRAGEEQQAPSPELYRELETPWFSLRGMTAATPGLTQGVLGGVMPEFLQVRRSIVPGDAVAAGTTLWTDGSHTLGYQLRVGRGRITVIATSQLLLDAALVDPHARAFCERLTRHLASDPPQRAAWLNLRDATSDQPPRMNQLSLLFLTPPFNIVIIHALVALLLFVWLRATWLGRTEALPDHRLERFGRHLDALAWRLRRARAYERCLGALAGLFGKNRPATSVTEQDALRQAQDLMTAGTESRPRPPPS